MDGHSRKSSSQGGRIRESGLPPKEFFARFPGSLAVLRLEDPHDLGSFRYLAMSDRAAESAGLKVEDVVGKRLGEVFPASLETGIPAILAEVIRAGKARDLGDNSFSDPRGQSVVFRIQAFPLPDQSVAVLYEDVTAKRKLESELQESEERFRLLVEQVKEYAILSTDPQGRISSWNEGAERMKGYRAEEILHQHISRFYTPEDVERGLPARLLKVAETEGQVEDEGWRVRKDGSSFWANVVITALRDDQGNLQGFSKVTRDVTERKRAEEALRELSGQLLQMQDADRRRIARELHDSTSPQVAALISRLHSVRRRAAGLDAVTLGFLDESLKLAQDVVEVVRNVSGTLHPPLLDEQGLAASLRWYLNDVANRTGMKVETHFPEELKRMSDEAELAAFRFVEQCLTEAFEPDLTGTTKVRLTPYEKVLTVEVSRESQALPLKLQRALSEGIAELGPGLAATRERLRQLGGDLEIDSRGSEIALKATLPFTNSP